MRGQVHLMSALASDIQVLKLATHSLSSVSNSQPAGIGRLAAIGELLVINNLGRNVEVADPHGDSLVPIHLFKQTAFPEDDQPSQFDLDIHGFLSCADRRHLISINHYGVIRLLAPVGRGDALARHHMESSLELISQRNLKWPGDAERFVFAGSSLLSSSPRGYAVSDAIETGILVSENWDQAIAGNPLSKGERFGAIDAHHLRYRRELGDWGIVTALALSNCQQMLAVAAGQRLAVFQLSYDRHKNVALEQSLWERTMACTISWLHFSQDSEDLLVAGCSLSCKDDNGADWDALSGGTLASLDRQTGESRWHQELGITLAWGNGGDPLVYVAGRKLIAGVERTGALYIWNLSGGSAQAASQPQSRESMGIAHIARLGSSIYCGFNRGGYNLFKYSL